VWADRDSQLNGVRGFVEFHLLRGPETDAHTLYASHTVWASREAFEAWTRSEAFRQAHATAGDHARLYLARISHRFAKRGRGDAGKDKARERPGAQACSSSTSSTRTERNVNR